MSFRRQLFLSLAVLVLVPAVIASLAIGRVVRANENAKTDAKLDASTRVATVLVDQYTVRATRRLTILERNDRFRSALASGDRDRIQATLDRVIPANLLAGAAVALPGGDTVRYGAQDTLGVAEVKVPLDDGGTADLTIGLTAAKTFVEDIKKSTGADAALLQSRAGAPLYRTASFPATRAVDLAKDPPVTRDRWRATRVDIPSSGQRPYSLVFAVNPERQNSALATRLVIIVLLGFIGVGLAIGYMLQRGLTARISGFLSAAERLGSGDFGAAQEIPIRGRGEFAALGRAFVGMARDLENRVDQLERERGRVQSSLLRLGKAFAANLDRDTLVDLVVESAVDGLTADSGRALMPTGPGGAPETRGSAGAVLDSWDALGEVERRALASGTSAAVTLGGLHAIAEPMRVERGEGPMGVISVARARPFESEERELLRYLTEQAAVSLRNVGRHEDVARESITDELTGLFNRRRFDDVLTHAAARATENDPIALVMLDLDRFKVINDTHGHPFGDTVLKAVAKVVRDAARDRDLPARYGGEELAVVLAIGDREAARAFAERLREGIQALSLGDERTGPVQVTASLGVASLPADGDDVGDLVRAADEALYRAKRGGRNRVEVATPAQGPAGEVR